MIQIVRGDYLVFDSLIVEGESMLWGVTLEDIEVFHCELLILVPPDPETLISSTTRLALLQKGSI